MNKILLTAEGVYKSYSSSGMDIDVLKGISLKVCRSEVLAVIGPSGAGKSTLLHILGGLDRPSKGIVMFDGIDLYAAGDRQCSAIRNKRIGFVFQFYHLLNEFSVIENVMMPAIISGKRGLRAGIKNKAESLLESVGLAKRLRHRPCQLSGGEQQRVSIARALINNPDIVFCDEPTGNLDSENSSKVFDTIRDLNKKSNLAFVIVTHNERVSESADSVLLIQDGVVKHRAV